MIYTVPRSYHCCRQSSVKAIAILSYISLVKNKNKNKRSSASWKKRIKNVSN